MSLTRTTAWAVAMSIVLVLASGLAFVAAVFHVAVLGVARLGPGV